MPNRGDRMFLLQKELKAQNITEFRLWDGVVHKVPRTGISRAHKQIVQYAKDNNLERITIAEDDVKFCFEGAYDYYIKNIPTDYDLYLASVYHGKIKDNLVADFAGLSLYTIHSRFYDTFLASDETIDVDIDMKDKGKFVVCCPFAAIQQSNVFSDNVREVVNYDSRLEKYRQTHLFTPNNHEF